MQLMVDANIQTVFVGIESPNEDSLRETKKFQNVRPAGSLVDRVRRIQDAGLEVWCGMILGFDHDTPAIFAAQREFLDQSRILHAMIGMLQAIPKTPLYQRLTDEGRLDPADHPEFGTNVVPLHMSREELRDGYLELMEALYKPQAYFQRLEDLYLRDRFQFGQARRQYWRRHPWTWFKSQCNDVIRSAYVYCRLMSNVPEAELRREYRTRLIRLLKRRPDPAVLFVYLIKCAMHFHHHVMVRDMTQGEQRVVNTF
jgi:radical SAM superfamily enzyme YgiQ (UPF0313 family)